MIHNNHNLSRFMTSALMSIAVLLTERCHGATDSAADPEIIAAARREYPFVKARCEEYLEKYAHYDGTMKRIIKGKPILELMPVGFKSFVELSDYSYISEMRKDGVVNIGAWKTQSKYIKYNTRVFEAAITAITGVESSKEIGQWVDGLSVPSAYLELIKMNANLHEYMPFYSVDPPQDAEIDRELLWDLRNLMGQVLQHARLRICGTYLTVTNSWKLNPDYTAYVALIKRRIHLAQQMCRQLGLPNIPIDMATQLGLPKPSTETQHSDAGDGTMPCTGDSDTTPEPSKFDANDCWKGCLTAYLNWQRDRRSGIARKKELQRIRKTNADGGWKQTSRDLN